MLKFSWFLLNSMNRKRGMQGRNRRYNKNNKPQNDCCGCICCIVVFIAVFGIGFAEIFDVFYFTSAIIWVFVLLFIFVFFYGFMNQQRARLMTPKFKRLDSRDKRVQYRRKTGRLPLILGIPSQGYKNWLVNSAEPESGQAISDSSKVIEVHPESEISPKAVIPAPRPQKEEAMSVERVEASFCPFCGSKVPKGLKICELCGSPID